ncbi:MAG: terminase [Gammaproteobacteria bacterium]|nr:terminase [Gammaproteobacteria bacterium]
MTLLDELLGRLGALPQAERAAVEKLAREGTGALPWVPNPGPQSDGYFTPADETFFGGQAGGGKTDLEIGLAITAHKRSLILRRINKDAAKLVNRVEAILGHRNGYNGQQQSWRLPDGRRIDFGGCELEIDKHRYKGEPHDLICFDEGSDFLYSQYRFIITWLRSEDPTQRCRVLVASNPPLTAAGLWVIKHWAAWLDKNHPRPARPGELRWFVTEGDEDVEVDGAGPHELRGRRVKARSRTFIPSAVEDNPDYAQGDYRSLLESLPEELRRAYGEGDFGVGQRDDDYQVIPTAWIEAAQQRWEDSHRARPGPPRGVAMTAMAVDVAPSGGDQRVICWRYGGWFAPLDAKREVDKTGRMTAAAVVLHRRDGCPVIVDLGGGYGGDAVIALKDNRIDVVAFNGVGPSGAMARGGKLKFSNKRAEAWWRFREELDPSQEGGSAIELPPDAELKADLASARWSLTTRGILLEDKDDIKERLGRSPDKGDAAVMCLAEGQRAVLRAMGRHTPAPQVQLGYARLKRNR